MTSISDSIVQITLKNKSQSTGWFFDKRSPYLLSSGHQFYDKHGGRVLNDEEEFDVNYKGEKLSAKVVDVVYEPKTSDDYSILLITSEIESWESLDISLPLGEAKGKEYEMSGFTESHGDKIPLVVNKKILDLYNYEGKTALFQLSEDSEFSKSGTSGGPICVNSNGSLYAIGIQIKQSTNPARTRLIAYALHNIGTHPIIRNAMSNAAAAINDPFGTRRTTLARQMSRFSFSLVPVDNSPGLERNLEIFEKFQSLWLEFELKNNKNIQQLNVDINYLNHINLDENWANFRKSNSFSHAISSRLKDKEQRCRIVIDFTEKFDFNVSAHTGISHQIGIRIGKEERFYSNDHYDLIVELNKDNELMDLMNSIYNLAEDIILDINLFNSTSSTKFIYNTLDKKRLFSRLKVQYALDHSYKFYGNDLGVGQVNYLPLGSLIRSDYQAQLEVAGLNIVWNQLVKEFLPTNKHTKSLIPKSKRVSSKTTKESLNNNEIHVNDVEDIIQELKNLKKLGGQINLRSANRELSEFSDDKVVIFALTRRRPKNRKHRESVCQLMGKERSNYRINMQRFFREHRMNDLRKFSYCLYIITFIITGKK